MTTYHVYYEDGEWVVHREGELEPFYSNKSKVEAQRFAKAHATRRGDTVVFYRRDGSIETEFGA